MFHIKSPPGVKLLNIRIKPQVRELIDRAAQVAGKNRTDFVLDAARRAAEDTLLDRTMFIVTPKAYQWRFPGPLGRSRLDRTSGSSRACRRRRCGNERTPHAA